MSARSMVPSIMPGIQQAINSLCQCLALLSTSIEMKQMLLEAQSIILWLFSQEHRQTYGNTREPLLENLTSEYDLDLFRRAQARASEDLVSIKTSKLRTICDGHLRTAKKNGQQSVRWDLNISLLLESLFPSPRYHYLGLSSFLFLFKINSPSSLPSSHRVVFFFFLTTSVPGRTSLVEVIIWIKQQVPPSLSWVICNSENLETGRYHPPCCSLNSV